MIKIDTPQQQCLRIYEYSVWPLVQLIILGTLVSGYYFSLLSDTGNRITSDFHFLALLIFPLFLSPYLLQIWRGINRRTNFEIDGMRGIVRGDGDVLIPFADITNIELSATNATCEELRLCVILKSGDKLQLYEGAAGKRISDLARRVAMIIGVALQR